MVGPLTCKAPNGTFVLRCFTMIDPNTGWFEVAEIKGTPTSDKVAQAFDHAWLSRYPRPKLIGYNNGSENKKDFKAMCNNYNIADKPTSGFNPQSNGIIERVHMVLADILRTFELEERELNPEDPFTEFLNAAAFAIRATYHTTLGCSPSQLVFGRDMILPIAFNANWDRIRHQRQEEVHQNNARENKARIPYTYNVGDEVYLRKEGILRKLSTPRTGPYPVTCVFDNGTVQIKRGSVLERVNIRRIMPHKKRL